MSPTLSLSSSLLPSPPQKRTPLLLSYFPTIFGFLVVDFLFWNYCGVYHFGVVFKLISTVKYFPYQLYHVLGSQLNNEQIWSNAAIWGSIAPSKIAGRLIYCPSHAIAAALLLLFSLEFPFQFISQFKVLCFNLPLHAPMHPS